MIIELYGDWCPGQLDVEVQFKSDFALINIEGPILDSDFNLELNKIFKVGPYLCSTTVPRFSATSVLSLANNHIMDYGSNGVEKTLEKFGNERNYFVGTDYSFHSADVVRIEIADGKYVSVIANAEHQYGYATYSNEGYTAISERTFHLIKQARDTGDFVIVSSHGGDEKSLLPSFARRDLLRSYINAGADVVWGHHAHVPQGWEFWKSGLICYGLGNFATDSSLISHDKLGKYSLTVSLDTENILASKFFTTIQEFDSARLTIEKKEISPTIASCYFKVINEILISDKLLLEYQDMYAQKIVTEFYSKIFPVFPIFYWFRYFWFSSLSMIKNAGQNRYAESITELKSHVSDCESHNEMYRYFKNRKKKIMRSNHSQMKALHIELFSRSWN
jgi:poly-gamma-glutamate capsule biosynthesis protein CapA/YwtB (metallophosphatase superfamily)